MNNSAWPTHGGEMGALMRSTDWSGTALGPLESWPASLKTMVGVALGSRFPMLIWWGPQMLQIYNDGYRTILGDKHPASLGAPGSQVWAEIWPVVGPMAEGVMAGGSATWSEDLQLMMNRKGYLEETYFTFSYSPIPDDQAGVAGVLVTCAETTQRVFDDRALRMIGDMAARAGEAQMSDDVCRGAASVLSAHAADFPFALFYLVKTSAALPILAAASGWSGGDADLAFPSPDGPDQRLVDSLSAWAAAGGEAQEALLADLGVPGLVPPGPFPTPSVRALSIPLRGSRQGAPYGFLVAGVSPCRELDPRYRAVFHHAAEQIAGGIARAEAYAEERKRAFALAELDRAKTAFFSNVSHEFRTPLTLILGPQEEALRSADRTLGGEQLESVHRNTVRLLKLVNTLLDFSRVEAGRAQAAFQPHDAGALTRDLTSVFRSAIEKGGLRFDVDCPSLAEPVHLDRDMWEKVVLNLLSNAFKFTFTGSIRVSLRDAGDHVELAVQDSGVGIPAADLPHVFERFHRVPGARGRTHEGSGIGLALVSEVVRMHGGAIEVRSTAGEGTTFLVSIPYGSAHLPVEQLQAAGTGGARLAPGAYVDEVEQWLPDEAPELPAGLADDLSRPRVLVAEDNRDMRAYVSRLLSTRWRVESVANGREALESARRARPDLILADVMMPGLDGFELVRALRADRRFVRTPVILLSARAGEDASGEGRSAGADDYLVKPFSGTDLLTRVETQLERARTRAAEEAERNDLFDLFVRAPVAIAVFRGPDHRYDFVNDAYQAAVGGRAVVGTRLVDALPEVEAQGLVPILDNVRETGKPFVAEAYPILLDRLDDGRLDERFFTFVVEAVPREDLILLTASEITKEVRARAAAEAANHAKDEFLAVLGHELRNPLAAILTTLGLLRVRGAQGDKEFATIERQVGQMARLVDDLLEIARIEKGRMELRKERVEVAEPVALAIEMVGATFALRNQRLTVTVPRVGLQVNADMQRLAQAVSNLLTNAAKYTERSGQVAISAAREGDEVVIRVRDTGMGMSPELRAKVFDAFVQGTHAIELSQGGLGLGLAIVKGLVDLHGGAVAAQSEGPGCGSEFVVRLPAAAPASALPAAPRAGTRSVVTAANAQRVLVVDDHEEAAEALAEYLRLFGHATRVALDGPSALRAAEEFRPTFAVLDIGLPSMDGYELAQRLRGSPGGNALRLLALTGFAAEAERQRSLDAGFDVHLVKPVAPERLRAIIDAGVAPAPASGPLTL